MEHVAPINKVFAAFNYGVTHDPLNYGTSKNFDRHRNFIDGVLACCKSDPFVQQGHDWERGYRAAFDYLAILCPITEVRPALTYRGRVCTHCGNKLDSHRHRFCSAECMKRADSLRKIEVRERAQLAILKERYERS